MKISILFENLNYQKTKTSLILELNSRHKFEKDVMEEYLKTISTQNMSVIDYRIDSIRPLPTQNNY